MLIIDDAGKMAAECRSGWLCSTSGLYILLLFYSLLLSSCVWTCSKKDIPANLTKGEPTKLYLFGHGHFILYSIWSSRGLRKSTKNKANKAVKLTSQHGRGYTVKIPLILLLLAGDIHLNPGPYNFSPEAIEWLTSYLQNREQCVKVNQDKSFFQM